MTMLTQEMKQKALDKAILSVAQRVDGKISHSASNLTFAILEAILKIRHPQYKDAVSAIRDTHELLKGADTVEELEIAEGLCKEQFYNNAVLESTIARDFSRSYISSMFNQLGVVIT